MDYPEAQCGLCGSKIPSSMSHECKRTPVDIAQLTSRAEAAEAALESCQADCAAYREALEWLGTVRPNVHASLSSYWEEVRATASQTLKNHASYGAALLEELRAARDLIGAGRALSKAVMTEAPKAYVEANQGWLEKLAAYDRAVGEK